MLDVRRVKQDDTAVLVEAGFLTNKVEAKRLRDRGYIDAMAEQIAEALARYRDTGANVAWQRP